MTEIAVIQKLSEQFNIYNKQTYCLNTSLNTLNQLDQQKTQIIVLLIVVSFNACTIAYFKGKLKQISLSSILMNLTTPSSSVAIASFANSSTATIVHDMLDTSTAVTLLASQTKAFNTTTAYPATTVQTVASFITASNKNRATTIIVYPTVAPESVVIPIVSCIFGFPILAFLVICCLRRRAKLARERDRRRNYDNMQDHAVSLVRFSPIHRLNNRSTRAISLRPERSLSQGFPSLELDTVVEERGSDMEQTQTETLNAESPLETVSYKMSFSS